MSEIVTDYNLTVQYELDNVDPAAHINWRLVNMHAGLHSKSQETPKHVRVRFGMFKSA